MSPRHLPFCIPAVLFVALGTLGVGCDAGAGPDDHDDGGFTLGATTTGLGIPIFSSATTTIVVERTGVERDILLSVANAPPGITVSFATNPIPPGATSSEATVAVAAGTPPGVVDVTIAGTGGSVEETLTLAVTAQTITVTGRVSVYSGSTVKVGMPGRPLVTPENNTFTFADVSPPYDLYTVDSNAGVPGVFYYQGLTRTDPILRSSFRPVIDRPYQYGLSGSTPVAPETMVVAWGLGGSQRTVAQGKYSLTAACGPTHGGFSGVVYGFQFATDPITGAPTEFTGYGSKSVTLLPHGNRADLTMAPVTETAPITGVITSPAGYPKPRVELMQQLGFSDSVALWTSPSIDTINAVIPRVAAGAAAVVASVSAYDGTFSGVVSPGLVAATDVSYALPSPPALLTPAEADTVLLSTPFTWSATADAVYEVDVSVGAPNPLELRIYTTATQATLDVLRGISLFIGTQQPYSWRVHAYGPYGSVNDAASLVELEPVSTINFRATSAHWQATSRTGTFILGSTMQ